MKKKLYLIDASYILFRSYFAIPHMQTKIRKPSLSTNAVFGYTKTLLSFIKTHKPEYIVCCFDRPEPSFRVKIYKDYKANREEMPDDLQEQMPFIHKVTKLLGIPSIDKKNYEADDVIGSLAHWAQKEAQTFIVSTDKDFAQLVNPQVCMVDPIKDIMYDERGVETKWSVPPSQMLDYLSIVGDASDNVPGVRGIGPKGAEKLLKEYQTLDNIYKNLQDLPDKLHQKLKDSKKEAFLSKKLITIKTDLKLVQDWSDVSKKDIQTESLDKFLQELEFHSIRKSLQSKQKTSSNDSSQSSSSETDSSLSSKHQKLKKQVVSVQKLYDSLKPYEIIGFHLYEDRAHVLSQKSWFEIRFSSPTVPQKLGQALCEKKVKWYGYDLKNIWHRLQVSHPIPIGDPMVAHHIITGETKKSLSHLLYEKFGEEHLDSTDQAILYISELRDTYIQMLKDQNLYHIYNDFELPTIRVLYKMEKKGICVDANHLKKEKINLEVDLKKLEKKIFSLAGHPFNIASPQQLAHVLFEEMGLKKGKKTKTGYSTDFDVLSSLSHPIAIPLLEYRELFKLKTTYVEGLLDVIDSKTKRVHTHFNQTLTSTGRLSSAKPNLQNIPIRTQRGRAIRSAFVAPKNHTLIAADYSQIELAVLAEMSGDKNLKRAFEKKEDIHQATASEIFDTPLSQVTEEQRAKAKQVNFGVTYGQTAFGLSESLGVSFVEARDIIDRYFKKFNRVESYIKDTLKQAYKQGYVQTLSGRKRPVPELKSKNANIKKFGERIVINSPIQGTAGEILKKAMIELDQSTFSSLVLSVHDELLFECSIKDKKEELRFIKEKMEEIPSLSIPVQVHIGESPCWNDTLSK